MEDLSAAASEDHEDHDRWMCWRKWFAWRPVKIDQQWHWFKIVYRKPIPKTYVTYDDWQKYEYGNIFHVLKDQENA